ncbi:hypothetical protein [Roseobacter weihaiensis]|uniref:hypothetical protein n=1 Tax=Roseobacter weihaiensis TaxID=2763262 RepID=UPI001D0BA0F2|nr:hypothetical protein [Roseobacter sp. H9]
MSTWRGGGYAVLAAFLTSPVHAFGQDGFVCNAGATGTPLILLVETLPTVILQPSDEVAFDVREFGYAVFVERRQNRVVFTIRHPRRDEGVTTIRIFTSATQSAEPLALEGPPPQVPGFAEPWEKSFRCLSAEKVWYGL